ncbi:MAG: aminotransferase class I/II-fold pyridoxal phosphate-dependent enzyme [Gemmatimonadetes bacterium]|nr:aminotransferase class I/II-fold pyridoxal phosphate-dependent enzyme [Gemmatimonadota bacterium]
MRIEPFLMERMQSTWENRVRYNLSESGVHPLRLAELLDPRELGDALLGYPQTNGSIELRRSISALYPGAGPPNVVVTNGTAEANFIVTWSVAEPGADIVVMVPNYMQIWGAAQALGARVRPFPLRQLGERWAPDLDELERAVTDRTRLIAVCNPNNPTGAILDEAEMRAVCDAASRVGAWLLADEVYQGAELEGETTPSFWGRYERVLVTCGFSKAYGLPGLRIGWVAGPSTKIEELWSYKDYTTIAPTVLSDRLGQLVLDPERRRRILERTRRILCAQYPTVAAWLERHREILALVPPRAGAIAYCDYDLDVNSTALIERLREEKSVLVVPGDHFGMDRFFRVGFGGEPDTLERGLALFSELLDSLSGRR